jgi:hypothetical protein
VNSGAITAGQNVAMATIVNAPAFSYGSPLLAVTQEVTESNDAPGLTSIGQTDWPSAVVLAGWLYETPAFVRALRNALPIMSARIGAASAAPAVAIPAVSARNRIITGTTVLNKSHIHNTVR